MLRYLTLLFLSASLLVGVACTSGGDTMSEMEHGGQEIAATVGDLTIANVQANMTLPTETGSFWMLITNNGTADDALIGAEVEGCGVIELHDMVIDDQGVMKMFMVEGGRIPIPAGETVELKRGGLHVMCLQKAAPLAEGTTTDIVLEFANAGKVTVTADVVNPGEMSGMEDHTDMSGE
ncbi:MAG: copper chaperone PCu(A)C [Chloroflexi bacterium]|nr:copper chaperone PCu(A)C [Chloroflexota bacterium]